MTIDGKEYHLDRRQEEEINDAFKLFEKKLNEAEKERIDVPNQLDGNTTVEREYRKAWNDYWVRVFEIVGHSGGESAYELNDPPKLGGRST